MLKSPILVLFGVGSGPRAECSQFQWGVGLYPVLLVLVMTADQGAVAAELKCSKQDCPANVHWSFYSGLFDGFIDGIVLAS